MTLLKNDAEISFWVTQSTLPSKFGYSNAAMIKLDQLQCYFCHCHSYIGNPLHHMRNLCIRSRGIYLAFFIIWLCAWIWVLDHGNPIEDFATPAADIKSNTRYEKSFEDCGFGLNHRNCIHCLTNILHQRILFGDCPIYQATLIHVLKSGSLY